MTDKTAMSDGNEALKSVQTLMMDGRFDEAASRLDAWLSDAPDHREALYMAAACARYRRDFPAAERFLDRLKAQAPELGRAHQEEGHLRRDQGQIPAALAAYQRATRFDPALEASWKAMADLHDARAEAGPAAAARAQVERIRAMPKELVAVAHMIAEDQLWKAEAVCRGFLQRTPHHVEGMRLLAEIARRFGVLDEAEFLLESAVEFAPDNITIRLDYVQILRQRQKFQTAVDQARVLYDRDPDDPVFQSRLAIESLQIGDAETALGLFDKVLTRLPDDPATWTSKGHALKTHGAQEDAIKAYRRAFRAMPGHGDAYYGLANLKTYRFTEDETEAMRAQLERRDLPFHDRVQLEFALAKALEDQGAYDEAFAHYAAGNALKRRQSKYDPDHMDEELRAQAKICAPSLFEARAGVGHDAADPIFIVGLPRAGSTLLEQILASHSKVDGTLELPNILTLSHALRGRKRVTAESRYPRILHDLPADKLAEMGAAYIRDTAIHRRGAPYFIDKMPNNFRHLGLIKLILPNAKVIDARRDPMACGVSNFKQLFAEGQEFTYDLTDIGRYYRGYVELMNHWDQALPGWILRVQHEDVVADLEGQVRRLLDFCELPFEDACLHFHETERAVRTASSEQVRRPINKDGLDAWTRFDAHLGPLRAALGPDLAPAV